VVLARVSKEGFYYMKKKLLITAVLAVVVVFLLWYGYREYSKSGDIWPKKEVLTTIE